MGDYLCPDDVEYEMVGQEMYQKTASVEALSGVVEEPSPMFSLDGNQLVLDYTWDAGYPASGR